MKGRLLERAVFHEHKVSRARAKRAESNIVRLIDVETYAANKNTPRENRFLARLLVNSLKDDVVNKKVYEGMFKSLIRRDLKSKAERLAICAEFRVVPEMEMLRHFPRHAVFLLAHKHWETRCFVKYLRDLASKKGVVDLPVDYNLYKPLFLSYGGEKLPLLAKAIRVYEDRVFPFPHDIGRMATANPVIAAIMYHHFSKDTLLPPALLTVRVSQKNKVKTGKPKAELTAKEEAQFLELADSADAQKRHEEAMRLEFNYEAALELAGQSVKKPIDKVRIPEKSSWKIVSLPNGDQTYDVSESDAKKWWKLLLNTKPFKPLKENPDLLLSHYHFDRKMLLLLVRAGVHPNPGPVYNASGLRQVSTWSTGVFRVQIPSCLLYLDLRVSGWSRLNVQDMLSEDVQEFTVCINSLILSDDEAHRWVTHPRSVVWVRRHDEAITIRDLLLISGIESNPGPKDRTKQSEKSQKGGKRNQQRNNNNDDRNKDQNRNNAQDASDRNVKSNDGKSKKGNRNSKGRGAAVLTAKAVGEAIKQAEMQAKIAEDVLLEVIDEARENGKDISHPDPPNATSADGQAVDKPKRPLPWVMASEKAWLYQADGPFGVLNLPLVLRRYAPNEIYTAGIMKVAENVIRALEIRRYLKRKRIIRSCILFSSFLLVLYKLVFLRSFGCPWKSMLLWVLSFLLSGSLHILSIASTVGRSFLSRTGAETKTLLSRHVGIALGVNDSVVEDLTIINETTEYREDFGLEKGCFSHVIDTHDIDQVIDPRPHTSRVVTAQEGSEVQKFCLGTLPHIEEYRENLSKELSFDGTLWSAMKLFSMGIVPDGLLTIEQLERVTSLRTRMSVSFSFYDVLVSAFLANTSGISSWDSKTVKMMASLTNVRWLSDKSVVTDPHQHAHRASHPRLPFWLWNESLHQNSYLNEQPCKSGPGL